MVVPQTKGNLLAMPSDLVAGKTRVWGKKEATRMRSKTARIYARWGGVFFPKLPKIRRRDGKLLESVFCEFAKKKINMGRRDEELLELLCQY
jgi:hypothetical protein